MNEIQKQLFNKAVGAWTGQIIKGSDVLDVHQTEQAVHLQHRHTGKKLRSWFYHSHLTESLQKEIKADLVVIEQSDYSVKKMYYVLVNEEEYLCGACFYTFDQENFYRFRYFEGKYIRYMFDPENSKKLIINGKHLYTTIVNHLKELPEYRLYEVTGLLEFKTNRERT